MCSRTWPTRSNTVWLLHVFQTHFPSFYPLSFLKTYQLLGYTSHSLCFYHKCFDHTYPSAGSIFPSHFHLNWTYFSFVSDEAFPNLCISSNLPFVGFPVTLNLSEHLHSCNYAFACVIWFYICLPRLESSSALFVTIFQHSAQWLAHRRWPVILSHEWESSRRIYVSEPWIQNYHSSSWIAKQ